MRFAYNCDTMELLVVHRVQGILHGLVHLECAHAKRVMFEDADNPQVFDNLTTWELPKLFRNVTGQDPDATWSVPVVRELLALRIGELKPRLVDDNELDRQTEVVLGQLSKKDCPHFRYVMGAKVPRTDSAPAAPLCIAKPFSAAQVAQAAISAVQRAAALSAARVLVQYAADNVPWAKNNACAPIAGDATVGNQTPEANIKLEIDMAKTPEEIAADKVAKELEAATKKAAAATAKAAKELEAAAAKEAKAVAAAAAAAAKEKIKTDAEAAKVANKLPEQHGITRPKADTLCGKAWATFDAISAKNGVPASIAEAKEQLTGMAEATVRTQYARWRKFHGVTGRIDAPKPVEAPAAAPVAETVPTA